jgi:hypothetical protein
MAKLGRGLIRGIMTLPYDDQYQLQNLCTFSGCLTGKIREKVRPQMASLLAVPVATVVWTPISSQKGGRIRETKLPMQELELKMWGTYAWGGGVVAGFYGTTLITSVLDITTGS